MSFATREFQHLPMLSYGEGPSNGPALLLLHGVTRCWRDWEPLIPALTSTWRVIGLDHRGHGGSAWKTSYYVTDYVADAVDFVRKEIATPVVILGHSLGAMVAAAVAAEVPELVRGIVLEDPPFHTMGSRIADTPWKDQFHGMREAARRGGSIEELTEALSQIRIPLRTGGFKRLGELRDQASLIWSGKCLATLDPEALTPVIEGRWLDGYDVNAVVSRIHCPVLLLQADPTAGGALSNEDSDAALDALPSIQHVRFSKAGHQLHRDRTETMLDAFQTFTASLPACHEYPQHG